MEIVFRLDWASLWVGVGLGWLSVVLLTLGIAFRQWKASKKQK